MRITKTNYCRYGSRNYGAHSMRLDLGDLGLWFSYDTVVAFQDGSGPVQVSVNCWGSTTGRHLNAIDGGDKKGRIDRTVFESSLDAVLVKHGLCLKE